jgi:LuxR family glucitol operon transcriptional activator
MGKDERGFLKMSASRKPRSIAATPQGLQRLKDARKDQGFTNDKISQLTYDKYGDAGVCKSSVDNFITKNKPVEPSTVRKITEVLGLQPEDVADPEQWRVVIREVKREGKSTPNIDVLRNRLNLSHLPCHNLPPQPNPFIGRKDELCNLMRLLSADHPAHIIEVDGIAGVGKTALVLEAAYCCLEYKFYGEAQNPITQNWNSSCQIPQFDLIIFVSAKESELLNGNSVKKLVVTRTLQEIYRTIADVLDEPVIINMDITKDNNYVPKIIKSFKSKGNVLLIVDNLETIQEKDKILSFLYELPIKSVITTRERNTFKPIRLDALTEAQSLLLVEQQLEEKSINYLTSDQKKSLCKATRGIPLAIIYSIGRLAIGIQVETIVNSLKPQREKDLLPNQEEELANFAFQEDSLIAFCFQKAVHDLQSQGSIAYQILMAIAIYKSPAYKESIRAVAGLETQPDRIFNDGISLLLQISLIRDNAGRYRMLPLTREYALAELQKNKEFKKEALDRWVNWYIQFTKKQYEEYEHKPERFRIGYENIEKEWTNIVGVLLFCKDDFRYEQLKEIWSYLNNYTNLRGRWKDRLSWLGYLSEMSMLKEDYSGAVNSISRRGRTLLLMGKPEQLREAEKLLLKAWGLRQYASFEDLDYVLNHLAGLSNRLERYEDAHKWLDIEQENLDKNMNLSDQEKLKYQIYIDRERAELLFMQGKYKESKLSCEAVIKNTAVMENGLRNANYVRRILADIAINENQLERAEELLQIVYEEVKANNDKRRIAYCEVSLTKLEKAKNQLPEAFEYIQKALNNFEYLGMRRDYDQALSLYKEIREKRLRT